MMLTALRKSINQIVYCMFTLHFHFLFTKLSLGAHMSVLIGMLLITCPWEGWGGDAGVQGWQEPWCVLIQTCDFSGFSYKQFMQVYR